MEGDTDPFIYFYFTNNFPYYNPHLWSLIYFIGNGGYLFIFIHLFNLFHFIYIWNLALYLFLIAPHHSRILIGLYEPDYMQ